jgi:glycosyltransferase involved in cell wall biosynthesis
MRVLISAYACGPGRGSEPAAGWEFARIAAERHDVWVLTRAANRAAIESRRHSAGLAGARFVYLDSPAMLWCRRLPYGKQAYYLAWQRLAGRAAVRLHRELQFDLVHHVTIAVDWMPAGVLALGGVRAVWGPIGGATGMPWPLWRWLGSRGILRELCREVLTRPMRAVFGRWAARRADVVVAQNADVAGVFRRWSRQLVVEPNVVVEPTGLIEPAARAEPTGAGEPTAPVEEAAGRRTALFIGRLIPHKGLRIAVATLARPEAARWRLRVLGEGPERAPAHRLARRLGLADRVEFAGAVPRREVLAALSAADALLAPSMYEGSGFAVAEAVAQGCPVVCTDRGGPALIVPDGRGIRVPVTGDLVRDLARALAAVGGRLPPSDRWSASRLRTVLDRLYQPAADPEGAG